MSRRRVSGENFRKWFSESGLLCDALTPASLDVLHATCRAPGSGDEVTWGEFLRAVARAAELLDAPFGAVASALIAVGPPPPTIPPDPEADGRGDRRHRLGERRARGRAHDSSVGRIAAPRDARREGRDARRRRVDGDDGNDDGRDDGRGEDGVARPGRRRRRRDDRAGDARATANPRESRADRSNASGRTCLRSRTRAADARRFRRRSTSRVASGRTAPSSRGSNAPNATPRATRTSRE